MPQGLIEAAAHAQTPEEPQSYGIMLAQVANNIDPCASGRVQIRYPGRPGVLAWARVAAPGAGLGRGTYCMPQIGDEVVVALHNGDEREPIIIGGLWNGAVDRPPTVSPEDAINKMVIRTTVGNQLVFSEAPPTVTIQSGPTLPGVIPTPPTPAGPPTIVLSPAGVQIMAGTNVITMTMKPAGIQIASGTNVINMTPDGITITATNLNLTASGAINLVAQGTCSVTAPLVRINS